jgi:hypothetical protein
MFVFFYDTQKFHVDTLFLHRCTAVEATTVYSDKTIYLSMVLQPVVRPQPLFQFLDLLNSR